MAPKKLKTVQDIRRESIAAQKQRKVPTGSAVDLLNKKNEAFLYGKRRRDQRRRDADDDSDEETDVEARMKRSGRKKAKLMKKPTPKPKTPSKKTVTDVEAWRPAGGEATFEDHKDDGLVTSTLGIARLPTWRADHFSTALKTLIAQHGKMEELIIQEIIYGGESLTDVFAEFESVSVAEEVKGKIQGELVDGRKLQVKFA